MLINILLLAFLAFAAYAAVTQYKNTDSNASPPRRILAALGLAGSALMAVALAWFNNP